MKAKIKSPEFFLNKNLKRGPQVILPKDCALILAYSGVEPGAKVVDAGTGSGFLSIFLATYLKPGKIYTYEMDEKSIEVSKENIKNSGMKDYITLRKKDITKGLKERNVDLITLDMKDAHKVFKHAHKSLKDGGKIVVYSPTAEHLLKSTKELHKHFKAIRTIEGIIREWKSEYTTRPETIGIMHTGFLTFAKK